MNSRGDGKFSRRRVFSQRLWRFEKFAVDVGRTSLCSRADSDELHFKPANIPPIINLAI